MGVVNCDEAFLEWHSPQALAPAKAAKGTEPFVGHQRWLFTRSLVVSGESAEGGDCPSTASSGSRHAASAVTATMPSERAQLVDDLAAGFHADLYIAVAQPNENEMRFKNVSTLPDRRQLRKVNFSCGVLRSRQRHRCERARVARSLCNGPTVLHWPR
jgi:hypothetical protein